MKSNHNIHATLGLTALCIFMGCGKENAPQRLVAGPKSAATTPSATRATAGPSESGKSITPLLATPTQSAPILPTRAPTPAASLATNPRPTIAPDQYAEVSARSARFTSTTQVLARFREELDGRKDSAGIITVEDALRLKQPVRRLASQLAIAGNLSQDDREAVTGCLEKAQAEIDRAASASDPAESRADLARAERFLQLGDQLLREK